MGKKRFNIETELEICDNYKENKSTFELAKEFNCSQTCIIKILRRHEICRRSFSDAGRKYSLDENYFDVVDSEDKAYWLGWLYADGCNHKQLDGWSIELNNEDKYILDIFKKYLKTNIPLYYRPEKIMKDKNGNTRYRKTDNQLMIGKSTNKLIISSQKMSEKLSKLGCVPAKSLILKFPTPEQVPEKFIPDFIRGIFEGDGTIYFDKKLNVKFVGTFEVLEGIKNFLIYQKVKTVKIYHKNINTSELHISNKLDILKFKELIYDNYINQNHTNSELILQRKYSKFYLNG